MYYQQASVIFFLYKIHAFYNSDIKREGMKIGVNLVYPQMALKNSVCKNYECMLCMLKSHSSVFR